MSEKEKSVVHEEEIDLYELFKLIVKRKYIIIGLFIFSIVASAILIFLLPKIYRGEVVLKISNKEVISKERTTKERTTKELISIIGKLDAERIRGILPRTHPFVSNLTIKEIKESADKIQIAVESKYPDKISEIIEEFVEYINNNPLIKRYFEESKERLLLQSAQLSKIIKEAEGSIDSLKKMLMTGKLTIVGFNPIELDKKLMELRLEKLGVDQAIKNLKGVEIVETHILKNPVKPKIKLIIVISAVSAIFLGIMTAFAIEYVERIKKERYERKDFQ
ncbi:Wzz/FepE/Etk N-terminal domain-containing protein [Thermodesulfovibrio hydrogeniphilus]